jgi:hypothetical protein
MKRAGSVSDRKHRKERVHLTDGQWIDRLALMRSPNARPHPVLRQEQPLRRRAGDK